MTSPGSPAAICSTPATPVITHASVDLSVGEAVELIAAAAVRASGSRRTSSSPGSSFAPARGRWRWSGSCAELARPGARPSGRQGSSSCVTRIVDLLPGRAVICGRYPPDPGPPSGRPHAVPGQALWLAATGRAFLAAFIELVRVKRRHRPDRPGPGTVLPGAGCAACETGSAHRPRMSSMGSAARGCRRCVTRLIRRRPVDPAAAGADAAALAETVLFWSGGRKATGAGDPRRAERPHGRPAEPPPAGTGRRPSAPRRPTPATRPLAGGRRSHPWPGW